MVFENAVSNSAQKFFVLEPEPISEIQYARTEYFCDDGPIGGAPTCRVCGEYIGMLRIIPPIELNLETFGKSWGDFAFGVDDCILVTANVKSAFIDAKIVGFERFENVKIRHVKKYRTFSIQPPVYELASICFSETSVDLVASGAIYEEPPTCEYCRAGIIMSIKRLILEANTWTGEDIFRPRGLTGDIVVTERFKKICDDRGFTNCHFIPCEEYSFNFYSGKLRRN
jgi:hypothetical protein